MSSSFLRKIFRSLLVVACALGLITLAKGVMRAKADEALMDVGGQLMKVAGSQEGAAPRVLVVNGAHMIFRTESSRDSVQVALQGFQEICEKTTENEAKLPAERRHAWRGGDAQRGFVACGLGGGTLSDTTRLVAAAREWAKTGRVNTEVPLNYLYAESRGGQTHLAHIEANLDIERMFPADSDAPLDPRTSLRMPQPPGARRTLSVSEMGRAYEVTVHNSEARSPAQTAAQHRLALEAQGMSVFAPHRERATAPNAPQSFFVQGPDLFALVVSESNGRGGTTTAMATSRAEGAAALESLLGVEQ